jgi:hypothetical protein
MLKLFEETPAVDKGEMILSETPGSGLTFDQDAVRRFRRVIRLVAVILALALAVPPAAADSVDDFTAAVPGVPGKTWMDLLRQVFPDIALGPKNEAVVRGDIALRPIEQDGVFTDECPDELKLSALEFSEARIAEKRRLIVGIATEGDVCAAPLALFEGSGEGKLLDAVNVKQDKNYSFSRDFTRALGPDGQLLVVTSFHINAGDGYGIETLILATTDKLLSIGSVFAKSEMDCRRSVSQEATVSIAPDYGPFARITGYVKTATRRLASDCQTPRGKEMIAITRTDWRWNAARRAYTRVPR